MLLKRYIKELIKTDDPVEDIAFSKAPAHRPEGGRVLIGVGTGKCGMRWMNKIFISHKNCRGGCERYRLYEAFYRYVTWNSLPVDLGGIYEMIDKTIRRDLAGADISFYSSPYFSFGVKDLVAKLKPDYVFYHLRSPHKVVNSLYVKGWYSSFPELNGDSVCVGPQPLRVPSLHRNFGRIFPIGEDYEAWGRLTRVGKIAWYYVTLNKFVYNSLQENNFKNTWYIKLEDVDQNYDYYRYVAEKFGLCPMMSEKDYVKFKMGMSNRSNVRRSLKEWSSDERKDFDEIIGPFMDIYDSIRTTGM